MADQISFNNGVAEMAYSGKTPWHGLGTLVDGLKTPQEMIAAAKLGWIVEKRPVYIADGEAFKVVDGFVAIHRPDKAVTFGVTSSRYEPIQNTQAAEIMDALVSEGGATVEVCGALGEGERCWMLSRIPDTFEVVKGDKVQCFVLLAWGHDGKHGVAGKLTPIRVVCNNTLTAALGRQWARSADIYVKHSKNAKIQIEEARTALGLIRTQAAQTAEAFQALAATKLDEPRNYFEAVFPMPASQGGDDHGFTDRLERWTKHQESVVAMYRTATKGQDIPGVAGTVWHGYNTVTEWCDHVYPVLQSGKVSTARHESVLFGAYADTKARALRVGLDLAGIA